MDLTSWNSFQTTHRQCLLSGSRVKTSIVSWTPLWQITLWAHLICCLACGTKITIARNVFPMKMFPVESSLWHRRFSKDVKTSVCSATSTKRIVAFIAALCSVWPWMCSNGRKWLATWPFVSPSNRKNCHKANLLSDSVSRLLSKRAW